MPTTPNPQDPQNPYPGQPGQSGQPGQPGNPGRPGQWAGQAHSADRPTPESVREQLRLFLIVLLGLLIVVALPLPFRLGGLVLAAASAWIGIRLMIALSALSRAGTAVRGRSSVVIGLALTGVLTLVLAAQAALYPIIVEQERCLSGANTQKAKDNCNRIYQERLDRLTDLSRGSGAKP